MNVGVKAGLGAMILALALVGAAQAKPKGCFSKPEISSDLIVRHGVFLRELSKLCEGFEAGGAQEWLDFDTAFGTRLKGERTRRESAFKREFPDSWLKVVTTFDARMVTFDRNLPVNDAFCADVKSLLDDNKKRGWASFTKQSKVVRDESTLDFKPCN